MALSKKARKVLDIAYADKKKSKEAADAIDAATLAATLAEVAVAFSATPTFTFGPSAAAQQMTLTGNVTSSTFAGGVAGGIYTIRLTQDATGSRTVAWPASVKWTGGTAPTLTATANKNDIITFYCDGTNYYGRSNLNY